MTLTLLIQKEVPPRERDKVISFLEKRGWSVNVQDEDYEDELGDSPTGSAVFPGADFDY
jgi:hypothetical protein